MCTFPGLQHTCYIVSLYAFWYRKLHLSAVEPTVCTVNLKHQHQISGFAVDMITVCHFALMVSNHTGGVHHGEKQTQIPCLFSTEIVKPPLALCFVATDFLPHFDHISNLFISPTTTFHTIPYILMSENIDTAG